MFEQAEVAAAPVYDAAQLLADEHLQARGSFVQVDDPDLGTMTVQAPVARLSETPGGVDHLGRALGADNDAVYGGLLGLDADRLDALRGGRHHLSDHLSRSKEAACAHHEPGVPSWPRRPAANACVRRRRPPAPTSCSSTSRTPAPRR